MSFHGGLIHEHSPTQEVVNASTHSQPRHGYGLLNRGSRALLRSANLSTVQGCHQFIQVSATRCSSTHSALDGIREK